MAINLTAPSQVRGLLSRYGIYPKKRYGQNFLVDQNTLNHLIQAMHLTPDDLVIEVGAGIGTATRELAATAKKVIAVELDDDLLPVLGETLDDLPNSEVLHADFLKIDLQTLIRDNSSSGTAKVFANLPYYITSPIITRLIDTRKSMQLAVLMIQREVADRLLAKPGTSDYSSLTVLVNFYTHLELIMRVSRKVFLPPPAVDSTALVMIPREKPAVAVRDEKLFFHIVRASFEKRRKTLDNALAGHSAIPLDKAKRAVAFEMAGIDPMRRGETLSLDEFGRLADCILEVRGE